MSRILEKIVLIIPVLLFCTGVTASEYRSDFPTIIRDTLIATDSLTFTGKEEALAKSVLRKKNKKPHSPHRATIMAMILPDQDRFITDSGGNCQFCMEGSGPRFTVCHGI